MDVLEFVASLVSSVLSWPVVVGVVVLVYQESLKELISRVKTLEARGGKATFGDRLGDVENSTKDAVEDVDPLTEAEPSLAPQVPAEQGPGDAMAMLKTWAELEIALRELYVAAGLSSGGRGRPPAPTTMAKTLNEKGHVNDAFVTSVRELQELRNEVAHTRYEPSSGEVAAYIETATELTRASRYFAKRSADANN